MAHIKKMVMHGFKSFAQKTEIDFDKGINLFVGPNGSGKSNVTDALSFVLGRLSIKSMRAAKARNLIFMGSKYIKPAKEACVELFFDNSDKSFNMDSTDVVLKRIVRRNGQSIYKINEETKNRGEVIELLAHAGVDPYGFNLIMQGQIQSIVKMHPEDRRVIIEDVAGISIYESRKEKSLKELEKTEERLKEISTILRERSAYLRNLEKEKSQAEKYKDAELVIKRAKASIFDRKKKEKEKEVSGVKKAIEEKEKLKGGIKVEIDSLHEEINSLGEQIQSINKHIQSASGIEQENLHSTLTNVKAELEGLKVRKEGYENRKREVEKRVEEMLRSIPAIEAEIEELREKSPIMAKKAEGVKKKREELAEIERERKKALTLKSDVNSLKERIKDREKQVNNLRAQSESLIGRMEEISARLEFNNEKDCASALKKHKEELDLKKKDISSLIQKEVENIKIISISESEIGRLLKIKSHLRELDICPLCQSKITEEHIAHVFKECDEKINYSEKEKQKALINVENAKKTETANAEDIKKIEEKVSKLAIEMISHKSLLERKDQLKRIVDDEKTISSEIVELTEKWRVLEEKSAGLDTIEEKYQQKIFEVEEMSSRSEEDVDTTLLYKERELESIKGITKRGKDDSAEIGRQILQIFHSIKEKSAKLAELESKEKELQERFKNMFSSRDELQKDIQEKSILISEQQQEFRQIEEQINYLKVGTAKLEAELEGIVSDLAEFSSVEVINASIPALEEKLAKSQEILRNIGAINMRALEAYEQVKKDYDIVQEKVNTLVKEKEDVMKIIEEIDRKKVRTFVKTFKAINTLFSTNFSKLSNKGIAYLEVENKEDIFSGGVNIVVKLAKGKYFDVTSLSGGEQTLVALSLLFAIQEYKPYHFYVLDEIDAALDKRNSERLASLLDQYMKSGQYIVITHNDALITNSDVLYGVSMHEGVSKILSLKISPEVANAEKRDATLQGS